MKQLTATIFLIVFAAANFSTTVIFINFYANQQYIAKNLCVNKARPDMHCCGKCLLQKKIKDDQAGKDRQYPGRKHENKDEIFSHVFTTDASPLLFKMLLKIYPPFNLYKFTDRSDDIFHPPLFEKSKV